MTIKDENGRELIGHVDIAGLLALPRAELAAVIGRIVRDTVTDEGEIEHAIEAVTETMALAARNQRRASVKVKRRHSPRRSAYLGDMASEGHNYTLRNL